MPLDNAVIEEFKNKLLEEKRRLSDELGRIGTKIGSTDTYKTSFNEIGTGEDENASEVEEYTDNLALENSLEKQLKEIDEALLKIENRTFGFCDNCGKEIGIERLRAYPAAKTCLDCK